MTFKETIQQDLSNILNADEVSESVVYTSGIVSKSVKAVLSVNDENDNDWNGGAAITATAVIRKSDLDEQPKPHDMIQDSSRMWYITNIVSEDMASYKVALIADLKVK